MPENPDIILRNGIVYDGTGAPPVKADLAIANGRVTKLESRIAGKGAKEIDAEGQWVMPGFIDLHTHYDAEVEVLPGLEESVRHGVTTVIMGNCSLSVALGTEEELLGIFCRVESLPRELLAKWLGGRVTWKSVKEYYDHLDTLPLGPNVGSFLGHSNVRAKVMGLDRSLKVPKAHKDEIKKMRAIVREALDAGYLGLSIDMLPWHRMDGDPYRGVSVPSQQAHPSEYAALADVVRERERVLQAAPNAVMKTSVARLVAMSTGILRKPLKTTIIAAMDVKTNRGIYKLATNMAKFANEFLNADIRWQALADPFLNFCDGVHTPLFEEFPTGVAAISSEPEKRRKMFRDPAYRKQFRKEWESRKDRVFHRNLSDMFVVSAPDASLAGKSFAKIAKEKGKEPLECFLDLLAEHDAELRWKTVVSNDREAPRRYVLGHEYTFPGFNDAGAHNRNMAFHDGGLKMLQQVQAHPDTMPLEKAIWKLTKGMADWLGIETGSIRPGDVADVAIVNPEKLKTGLGDPVEYKDPNLGGLMRMVKRSEGVVTNVLVGGKVAFEK
ncbi:MAG: amidohydrolase family protein, partial [Bdellovibrionota bacterium]